MGSAARPPGRAGGQRRGARRLPRGFGGCSAAARSAQRRGQPGRALPLRPGQTLPRPLHPAGVSVPLASPCAAPAPARSPPRPRSARTAEILGAAAARETFARLPNSATIS